VETVPPAFEIVTKKAVGPTPEETARNPRARSAKLRIARRTGAPAAAVDPASLAMPMVKGLTR